MKLIRARDRVRTGDIQLGRLTLYQLSYSRINNANICNLTNYLQQKNYNFLKK